MNDIEWTRDSADDCKAEWNGYALRANVALDRTWWWAVYKQGHFVENNYTAELPHPRGEAQARWLCELVAKAHAYDALIEKGGVEFQIETALNAEAE